MTANATTFLIGIQCTTGKSHLTTTKGQPRCGMGKSVRHWLSVLDDRKTIESIDCLKCRSIAAREIEKNNKSSFSR